MKTPSRFLPVLCAGLFLFSGTFLAAEQLTTVAVVDIAKVYSSFYKDSQAVRDFEKMQQDVQTELNKLMDRLKDLNNQRLAARQAGRQDEVNRLEKEFISLRDYTNAYKAMKNDELKSIKENLSNSDTFRKELTEALKFVALENGFSMIVDSDDSDLLFWSPDVDVTDLVLERLRKTLAN